MSAGRKIPWFAFLSFVLLCVNVWAWIWTTTTWNDFEDTCYIWRHGAIEDRFGIESGHLGWFRMKTHAGDDLSWVPGFYKVDITFLGNGYFQTPAVMIDPSKVMCNGDFHGLMIHCWLVTLLTAILPLRWVILFLRHRRTSAANLCSKCGYDLRAHAPGAKCPECGTPKTPPPDAARGRSP